MNKSIVFLLLFCLMQFILSSCDSEMSNDKTPPDIELLYQADVLYLDSTFATKDSAANRDLNLLIMRFLDNEALSSYIVKLKPGTGFSNPNDTLHAVTGSDTLAFDGVITTPRANIFGLKDVIVRSQLVRIGSTFTKYNLITNKTDTYQIRPGNYFLTIECVDKAGNNTIYTSQKEILVSYRPRNPIVN